MAYCSSCGKELQPNAKFCTSCGTPVTQNVNPQQQVYSHQKIQQSTASKVTCKSDHTYGPECGRMTDSLKSYGLFESCVFLICYISYRRAQYTCCPDCMRKHLIEKGILTSKVITANFFWLVFILPLTLIELYFCGQKGHSKGV